MHLDAIDLKDFYARRLGMMVRRLLRRRIRSRWSGVRGLRVFGLGYATPYLTEFRGEAQSLAPEFRQIGGGIAQPEDAKPADVAPAGPDAAAQEPPHHHPEAAGVEILEVDCVEMHGSS